MVLIILVGAAILFVTERFRVDVVALLVLVALTVTGLVTPSQAVSGFSSPAVITVWAVFILSGGLSRTGVGGIIGGQVLRLAGQEESRLTIVIMLTAALMSAFMNNIGVAALLLPVVMDIARRTGHPPSRLLMPLAFGSLLGGLNTLIGTPPNLLVSNALDEYGLQSFQFFDFASVGLIVMVTGVTFMTLIGRHLLPKRTIINPGGNGNRVNLQQLYKLRTRLFEVDIPPDSLLDGKSIAESHLGSGLGLNVLCIIRNGQMHRAPTPDTLLHANDHLLVEGRSERLSTLNHGGQFLVEAEDVTINQPDLHEIAVAELTLPPESFVIGKTLQQLDFRDRYGVNVLAIRRGDLLKRTKLQDMQLNVDDVLLVQGSPAQIEALRNLADFRFAGVDAAEQYRLHERLLIVHIPAESSLVGQTLFDSRLGDAFGLTVLSIVRQGKMILVPRETMVLLAEDTLMVEGKPEDLATLPGLQGLEIDQTVSLPLSELESERVGLVEAVLSPHTTLADQTLRELRFQDKYGLTVLAIWHAGRAYRSDLHDRPLRFGDALLLYGPRDKISLLANDADFLILAESTQTIPRRKKAPLAALLMGAVILSVIINWLPIHIAAIIGATLMVVGGCLTMEEAYHYIEWKAVFLIAGMLPLGIAMDQSGAAQFLAQGIISASGSSGSLAVIASLFVLTTLTTQVMPNAAVAVLLAPIALSTATNLGLSPYALLMTVALAASASFLSPVAHPANVLVMGPGGYRFTDYLKVGLPLSFTILVVVLLVLPFVWPIYP